MKPLPLLPAYDEALGRVLDVAPRLDAERVALADALGRVLREPIAADRDQPPFDRSAMDGFAVRSGEIAADQTFPVAGSVPAGAAPHLFQSSMAAGSVMRIATGAPLPAGADAVIQIEKAVVEPGQAGERVRFEIEGVKPWQNIHRRGADAAAEAPLLAPGSVLGPQHLGILAAVGVAHPLLAVRPRVVVLTTGDEVVDPATATGALQPQQIRNSNGPMLGALLARAGAQLLRHEHVVDEPGPTRDAAERALTEADLVVTVGGVSVGQRDHLPATWNALGLRTIVHGVAIQPGKPVLVAQQEATGKLVLGLPGNPVSVWTTAHLFALPTVAHMLAAKSASWREIELGEEAKPSIKRAVFRAAAVASDGRARIIAWHGSGDLVHTAGADVLVRLPQQAEPIAAGTRLRALPVL